MSELKMRAKKFLTHMDKKSRHELFNDLLALQHVYKLNSKTSFYAFSFPKKGLQKLVTQRGCLFQYQNNQNDELIIQQVHQQILFKHSYQFKVFYNLVELDFSFIEELLALLTEEKMPTPAISY